jgi:hypothetical protein
MILLPVVIDIDPTAPLDRIVIGTAPDAARYATAAFLFGDRASIGQR